MRTGDGERRVGGGHVGARALLRRGTFGSWAGDRSGRRASPRLMATTPPDAAMTSRPAAAWGGAAFHRAPGPSPKPRGHFSRQSNARMMASVGAETNSCLAPGLPLGLPSALLLVYVRPTLDVRPDLPHIGTRVGIIFYSTLNRLPRRRQRRPLSNTTLPERAFLIPGSSALYQSLITCRSRVGQRSCADQLLVTC